MITKKFGIDFKYEGGALTLNAFDVSENGYHEPKALDYYDI